MAVHWFSSQPCWPHHKRPDTDPASKSPPVEFRTRLPPSTFWPVAIYTRHWGRIRDQWVEENCIHCYCHSLQSVTSGPQSIPHMARACWGHCPVPTRGGYRRQWLFTASWCLCQSRETYPGSSSTGLIPTRSPSFEDWTADSSYQPFGIPCTRVW